MLASMHAQAVAAAVIMVVMTEQENQVMREESQTIRTAVGTMIDVIQMSQILHVLCIKPATQPDGVLQEFCVLKLVMTKVEVGC